MYFVSIYESRKMKPTGVVLRRWEGGRWNMMEGVNLRYKHICKYHNVFPYNNYILIKI
jgi:hypothetical protein